MMTLTKSNLLRLAGLFAVGFGAAALGGGPGSGRVEAGMVSALRFTLSTTISAERAALGQDPEQPAAEPPAEPPAGVDVEDPRPAPAINLARLWDRKRRSAAEVRIERALLESTEVSFEDNPLEECLNYLEDLHHMEIRIDRRALEDEGVTVDAPVTLNMSGISLKSALDLILEPLALDCLIKNDVLLVTTRSKADKMREVRVYNVSRLNGITTSELEEIIRSTVAPETWSPDRQKTAIGATTRPESAVGIKSPTAAAPDKATAGTEATAAPANTARDAGGSIRYTANSLIIRQTQRVHEEIVDLLNQLERSRDNRVGPGLQPTVTTDDYSR